MNVTRENLAEAAAQLEALLPSAAFVAMDEEMTGITLQGQPEQVQDLPSRRYAKMRNVASRYSIIQFGICLFHETENGSGYVARPYNFYLFPEAGIVTMEGSSINFLRDHKMDFNKWIYEGIPFVNKDGAERLHSSLFPENSGENGSGGGEKRTPIVLTKKSDIEITDKAIAGIKEWLADETKKEETEYEALTTNPYIRRFMYEKVAATFPELMAESRPVPGVRGRSAFVVLRLSEAQKAERAAKVRSEKEQEYAKKIGFHRIFKILYEAKKPLIGHNCMYDLLFMMSHFEGPLPKSYETFREIFHSRFPVLLDTKLLATREPFKFKPRAEDGGASDAPAEQEHRFGSTALGEVFKVFQEETVAAKEAGRPVIEVSFAPTFDRYANDASAAHEAGYDAYMTGYAFAHMAKEALKPEGLSAVGNRTPIFRSFFDFNLGGGDESKLQDGVYVHVTGLKGRDAKDLREAFAEVKAPGSADAPNVQISWIDDDSAFAVLPMACGDALSAKLQSSRTEGGLHFTPGEEWFAAQTAAEACRAEEAGPEAGAPPAKRART
mmetsp:Transcript_27351/g.64259  ORF Transcript_27351/g.64259 Transcript_27351/m.64259 type:complete len:553 (+) Transcript_27351:119-1777(+)